MSENKRINLNEENETHNGNSWKLEKPITSCEQNGKYLQNQGV